MRRTFQCDCPVIDCFRPFISPALASKVEIYKEDDDNVDPLASLLQWRLLDLAVHIYAAGRRVQVP